MVLFPSLSFHTFAQTTIPMTLDVISADPEKSYMVKENQTEASKKKENSKELTHSNENVLAKSVTPIIGKNYFNFVGSAADIPREWIFGVSVSHFYCDGYCETFFEFTGATGERIKEVKLKVTGGRVRTGFFYNPLNSKRLILGLGTDISLRYDKVINRYQNIVSRDIIFSADFGLGVRIRFLLDEAVSRQDNNVKKYIVLSYRAFAQTVLRSCKKVSNTDAPFEGCKNAQALQTYEDYLVHGGGYEVNLGLEFRF